MKAIVAYDEDRGIGRGGEIPWDLPGDRRLFRELTLGEKVIMGARTWESLPRPLDGRFTIVLTSNPSDPRFEKADWPTSEWDEVAALFPDAFVIGGEAVYKQFLPLVDFIYASEVPGRWGCDKFFPAVPEFEAEGYWRCKEFRVQELHRAVPPAG